MYSFPDSKLPNEELKLDTKLFKDIEGMRKAFEIYINDQKKKGENTNHDAHAWFLGNLGDTGIFIAMAPSDRTKPLGEKYMDYVLQAIMEAAGAELGQDLKNED